MSSRKSSQENAQQTGDDDRQDHAAEHDSDVHERRSAEPSAEIQNGSHWATRNHVTGCKRRLRLNPAEYLNTFMIRLSAVTT